MTVKISLNNIRITGRDKTYYMHQLQVFADKMPLKFPDMDIQSVCFGKQDIRGGISITFFNSKHCVPHQKFFDSKQEMIGFVCGYNSANSGNSYL